MFEDIYGKQPEKVVCASPSTAPERLKKAIVHIFAAKTKRTAIKCLKRVILFSLKNGLLDLRVQPTFHGRVEE